MSFIKYFYKINKIKILIDVCLTNIITHQQVHTQFNLTIFQVIFSFDRIRNMKLFSVQNILTK